MKVSILKALALVFLLGCAAPAQSAQATLYQDLGGHEGLTRIVHDLLDLSLKDDRIKKTFDNTAIPRLEKLIVEQLCHVSGGPCKYTGKDMHKVHKPLHINTLQFNALVEDLQTAMDRNHVPFRTQNRLLALLAPMKRDIVTR